MDTMRNVELVPLCCFSHTRHAASAMRRLHIGGEHIEIKKQRRDALYRADRSAPSRIAARAHTRIGKLAIRKRRAMIAAATAKGCACASIPATRTASLTLGPF